MMIRNKKAKIISLCMLSAIFFVLFFVLFFTSRSSQSAAAEETEPLQPATEYSVENVSADYGNDYEIKTTAPSGVTVAFSYAVRGETDSEPAEHTEWHTEKPVNAGYYWIKATFADPSASEEQTAYGMLTVYKAILTATPVGQMTYGDDFETASKNMVYTGWKGEVLPVTETGIVYTLSGNAEGQLLAVKEGGYPLRAEGEPFSITIKEGRDGTYGFDIHNYQIEIQVGIFTVNKKPVEVAIDNLTAVYGEAFAPAQVQLTEASLARLAETDRENAFKALGVTPAVDGTPTSKGYYDADSYVLYSTGHENSLNYTVTVKPGIYKVESLGVYVTVDAGGGEYGSVVPAKKAGIFIAADGENAEERFGEIAVEFRYSGIANNGEEYVNTVGVPELAGSYTALATLQDKNFSLVSDKGTPGVTFLITRKAIDESKLKVEELKYNGEYQEIKVVDGEGEKPYSVEKVAYQDVGSYTVTLRLNDADNYKWSTVESSEYKLPFSIGKGDNQVTVTMEGWTYGESAKLPAVTARFTDGASYIYSYSPEENGEYTATVPTLTGTYWVKVTVPQTDNYHAATSVPVSFTISKRTLDAPTLELIFEGEGANTVYTGSRLQATVRGYDSALMRIRYDGDMSSDMGTLVVYALQAGEYRVYFGLNDTDNYAWAEGTTLSENSAVRVWTIRETDGNIVSVEDVTADYGEKYEITASAIYGGEIEFTYSVRGETDSEPAENTDWHTEKPVNAGDYWIKATCIGTTDFAERAAYAKLKINRITLTATPEGSMTYGDDFQSAQTFITYDGWKGEALNVEENVIFALADYDGNGIIEFREGGYVLTMTGEFTVPEGNDEIYGFAVENYSVDVHNGVFTVNKKPVEVTLDNLTAVYGEEFDAAQVKLTPDSLSWLVEEDRENAFEALSITPTVLGDKTNGYYNASTYVLRSEGHEFSQNYAVTVRSGLYKVESLNVYITVNAGGGEYGAVVPAQKAGIFTEEGDENAEEIFGELAVEFRYSGTPNEGDALNNTLKVPELAGSYTAVARLIDNNFNLVTDKGTPSVTFLVSRKAINESAIKVKELKYTGNAQTPQLVDAKNGELYRAETVTVKDVGSYTLTLTLNDASNYKWSNAEGGEYKLLFAVGRGENAFLSDVEMKSWTYGEDANLPVAETVFGDPSSYIYTYSKTEHGEYTGTVPTSAGWYWVKVTVPQTANYNEKTSEPGYFQIYKRVLDAPTLEFISEGEGANNIYTGERLRADVTGYDSALMRIVYEGDVTLTDRVAVFATNAGSYDIRFALNDTANYAWAEGTNLSGEEAQVIWSIARKKIEKPAMPSQTFMVNGRTLTFTPDGFDESTMTISGNTATYGGVFKVTVSIKDPVNYEWTDGSVGDVAFDWFIVGWDTVFVIVISVLGIVSAIAICAIVTQYLLHRRKKQKEAERTAAQRAILEREAAKAENGGEPVPEGETTEESEEPVPEGETIEESEEPVPEGETIEESEEPIPEGETTEESEEPVPEGETTEESEEPVPEITEENKEEEGLTEEVNSDEPESDEQEINAEEGKEHE